MKKKLISLVLCLLMLAPLCAAGAEEAAVSTANATVDAANTVQLTAPFAGVLLPCDWNGGERISSPQTAHCRAFLPRKATFART